MTTNNNFLIRYGKFSGPGYSGGAVLANGQLITAAQTAVSAVDYIDSLAKQHDINYQYFEKVFANNPAQLKRALWEADKAAVYSALQYTPQNWMERAYRELFINAFIVKAQAGDYKNDPQIVSEATALAVSVPAIDPSIRVVSPNLATLIGAGLQQNTLRYAMQPLLTSDLSSQERMLFNSHLKSISDVVIPANNPEQLPTNPNDFTKLPIVPMDCDGQSWRASFPFLHHVLEV